MPDIVGIMQYTDLTPTRPACAFVHGHREGSRIDLRRVASTKFDPAGLQIVLTSSGGATAHDLRLNTKGARTLRDYLIQFCDDMAEHPEPPL